MRVYAAAAAQRSKLLPDVPTGAEQGLPGFNIDIWYGMLAPAGTPPAIVGKLNSAINRILAKPEVQASLATSYATAVGGTPAQFADKIRSDVQRYGQVITQANIRID